MRKRRTVAWLLAVVLVAMLVPASGAMGFNAAEKKHEKKQNTAIGKAGKAAARALTRIAALTTTVGDHTKSLAELQTLANGIDSRLKTIEAGVPQVLDGLTKLQAAALQLKAGLETAGAGLTTLGDAYKAVEYGRAQLFYSANGTAVAGTAVTSADIPDDGNTTSVVDDAIVAVTATSPLTINLRAAIRSAESDGDDAAETAGQAGGFVQVYNGNNGDSIACAGSTAPLGIFGTQPGDSIVTPSGTVTNLPLKNIPGGNLRTDTTHPDATSTSLLPAACTIAGATAGDVYKVHYSVSFLDIPTTTTPGPTE